VSAGSTATAVISGGISNLRIFCPGYDAARVFFSPVSEVGRSKVVSIGSYLKVQSSAENCCDRTKLRFNTGSAGATDSHETSEVSCLEPSLKRS
jgi:hypothetical protein